MTGRRVRYPDFEFKVSNKFNLNTFQQFSCANNGKHFPMGFRRKNKENKTKNIRFVCFHFIEWMTYYKTVIEAPYQWDLCAGVGTHI